jgi:DNA helicase-2/ATP-dependent DNA helicase PcrA
VGYRSTRQIADFARALLGPLASRADALHSTQEGPPVEVLSFPSQGALVAALAPELRRLRQADPDSTVAVIAPDLALAAMIHEGLRRAELPRLRLVQDQDFPFEPGIDVCELRDVKGLEFDHVVLVGASAEHFPDTDLSRRRLHVAVTRAVHQAWITLVGTPAVAIRPFVAS